MAKALNNGLITKEIASVRDMSARNRYTRDAFE